MSLLPLLLATSGSALAGGSASPPPPAPPAVDFSSLPDSAARRGPDNAGKPHPVLARLLVDTSSLAAGGTARVGVHLTQDEGWHTYWKSPGDIGLPTEIAWSGLPEGVTVSPHVYPVPQRFEQDGQVSFGYDREVLLTSVVTVPPGTPPGAATLVAEVSWLVCLTSCIPGSAHLELPVTIAAAPGTPTPWAPLFDHYALQHPQPAAAVDAFTWTFSTSRSAVTPNDKFSAAFVLTPTSGPFADPGATAWPTFTPIATSYDWSVSGATVRALPDGRIAVVLSGETYEPDPLPASQKVGGLVQVKVGDRWVRTELEGDLAWVAAGTPVASNDDPVFALAAAGPAAAPHAPADPPVATAVAVPAAQTGSGAVSLLANLALAFVGGLILNVMPCVLPVLTLKLYGLVEQTDITAAQRRSSGLAYTGGVLASFWLLAAAVIGLRAMFGMQVDWGFQFQYPPYVAGLATVVFAFGLSLLGVFEIPALGANAADEAASSREGLFGTFLTGVFATLLATPCSAPFLGTAIAYAFSAPTLVLLLIFTLVGLGLAAPFLLVAFVPTLFRFLPRPGEWMDTFKQVLGFTLMATTVWLIDVLLAQIGPDRTTGFLGFLLAVGVGAWVFGRFGGVAASGRRQLAAATVGFGIAGLAGAGLLDLQMAEAAECDDGTVRTELAYDHEIPWQPFSSQRLDALAGKPVFVDFTAEWCLTCKVNERTILETTEVRSKMGELGVVPLKADWTRRDEEITDWLRRHGRAGVPMYLVVPADRTRQAIVLPEVITPGMVNEALVDASR